MRYRLSMSNSEAYYEKSIDLERETEPTDEECMEIAKANGYRHAWLEELWYLNLKEDK